MNPLQTLVLAALVVGAAPSPAADPPAPPNLVVRVSDWLVNAAIQQARDELQPVEDCILGTWFLGISRSTGQLHAQLVPDPSHGVVDLVFTGASHAQSIGYRSDFRVYTLTGTPFEARKRIAINGKELRHEFATAAACADSQIVGLTNSRGDNHSIPVLIARAKACQDKSQGDAITSDLARCRLTTRLDEDTYPALVRASRALVTGVKLVRSLGLSLEPFEWSTTAHHLEVKVPVSAPSQPAFSSSPPALPAQADLSIGLHQSLINELIQVTFAGKTLSLSELADALKEGFSPLLPSGHLDAGRADFTKLLGTFEGLGVKPFSIGFASKAPVTVTLADRGYTVVIHGAQFKSGEKSYPPVDVKFSYRIERTGDSFALVRQGIVQVIPHPGAVPQPALVVRTSLQLALNLLFVDRLSLSPLSLPTLSGPQTSVLVPLQADVKEGWVQLSWVRQSK